MKYDQGHTKDLNLQHSTFVTNLFWASGDNLGLKQPANFSKQVVFAPGVQKKLKCCRANNHSIRDVFPLEFLSNI